MSDTFEIDPAHSIAFGPMVRDSLGTPHRPFRYFSADGLALAGRDYRPINATDRRPVVCLPGLTRSGNDFEPVIPRLLAPSPGTTGRRVITFDFRGRGASQYAADPATYTPLQELADTQLGLRLLGIDRITAFGTSRGGIVTMLAALVAPGLVEAAVLNDIGAVIDTAGLLRIKGYVGRSLAPETTWDGLTKAMMAVNSREFPRLDLDGFERFARRIFRDVGGRPALDYDPTLALGFANVTEDAPLPDLWAPYQAMTGTPTLVVRGALSDLLSAETVAAMESANPACRSIVVPDEGHAPLFEDEASQNALVAWLDSVGA